MARIVIMTGGTHGDVAPFLGLGQRLIQAGHLVRVAGAEQVAGFLVTDTGLDFHA